MLDLTGMIFGKRKVLAFSHKRNSHYYWQVECACGDIRPITAHNLLRGQANQCAKCLRQAQHLQPPSLKPIPIGTQIGKRTILAVVQVIGKKPHLRVRCECGREDVVAKAALKSGMANQCKDCQAKKTGIRSTTHGFSPRGKRTPAYYSWMSMRGRCLCPTYTNWRLYGGRGITICSRWQGVQGFENFVSDMGERPEGKTLDRFPNVNGNYEPGNCRWATPKEQVANQRKHGLIEIFTNEELLAELQRRGVK